MDIKVLAEQIIGIGAFVGLVPDATQKSYMERRIEELIRGVIGRELQEFNTRCNAACERQILRCMKSTYERCVLMLEPQPCGCADRIRAISKET